MTATHCRQSPHNTHEDGGADNGEKRIGSLLVIEADEMVGIVTETDVAKKGMAFHPPASSTRVGAVMNDHLTQIDINRTVRHTSRLMAEERIRHLAVTEDNKVVGYYLCATWSRWCPCETNPGSFTIHNAAHLVHRSMVWVKTRFHGRAERLPLNGFPPFRDRPSPVGLVLASHVISACNLLPLGPTLGISRSPISPHILCLALWTQEGLRCVHSASNSPRLSWNYIVELNTSDVHPQSLPMSPSCAHSRLISDSVTEEEHRTGKVRCIECGGIVPDPQLQRDGKGT